MPKPDLSGIRPDIREAIIRRRNEKLAERGRPLEVYDPVTRQVVERDQYIQTWVDARVTEALATATAPPAEAPPAAAPAPLTAAQLATMPDAQRETVLSEAWSAVFAGQDQRRASAHAPFWQDVTPLADNVA